MTRTDKERARLVKLVRFAQRLQRVERALRVEAEEECGRLFDAVTPQERDAARVGMASCLAAADALAQLDYVP